MLTNKQWAAGSGRQRGPRRRKRLRLVALAIGLLLFAGVVVVASAFEPAAPAAAGLNWQVVASGGQTMSSLSYTLLSTTGQPVTGAASGGGYSMLSGYWYGFQEFVRTILLPFIVGSP